MHSLKPIEISTETFVGKDKQLIYFTIKKIICKKYLKFV